MKPKFFRTPADFRKWLEHNHHKKSELIVGFHKKGSGKQSITWPESVDEALCFGWIDGIRHSFDENSYTIRFTPRKRTSIWSAVNCRRVAQLMKEKRMRPAGLAAWKARDPKKSRIYAYEQAKAATFDKKTERQFKKHHAAWKFFLSQPAGYRRLVTRSVMSAKQDATKQRRLQTLIEDSAAGLRIRQLRRSR